MTIELLTPVSTAKGEIVDLARKRYKKQILPLTEITYAGKKKRFDLSYMQKVEAAFKAGAFPYIPVKLAGKDSSHTEDVLRTGGRLVDLELSAKDGLTGIFELNDDGIKAVQDSDGEVPVSVKIFEQLKRDDGAGESFDAALAHVLMTDDPYVRGMQPWKETTPVSLSENRESVTETIDLSAEHFGTEENMTDTKQKVTLELTAAQRDRLIELANQEDELKELGLTEEQFEDPDDEDEDAETEEEVETVTETKDAEKVVGLSRQATKAIQLAQAAADEAKAQTLQLSRQLQQANIDREIGELERKGLAPAILKLARPALEQPQVVELTRGNKVEKTDSGAIMRDVLNEVIELARTGHDVIDLERLSGVLVDDEETAQATMDAQLKALSAAFDS